MYGEDVTIAGTPKLTLLNSGFWTLHPIYTNNIHIHNIDIIASNCTVWDNEACGLNIDGIDVDSSQNVIIENNYIAVGDDHVTVLSGGGQAGRLYNAPSRNVTVKNNILGHGMGELVYVLFHVFYNSSSFVCSHGNFILQNAHIIQVCQLEAQLVVG
jgi:polygalacturonase